MMMKKGFLFFYLLFAISQINAQENLANSQRLKWWREARFGLFIHWGPCTLTGADISWSRGKELPVDIYDHLYKQFNPVNFDAKKWVQYAKDAGMKYIIFVAKHHDGFVMWDSKLTGYKITNTPFKRDVLRELTDAAHAAGMPIGVYFSPGDWKDPDCRSKTNDVFVKRMHGYLTEILTQYGAISHVWIDYDGFPCPSNPEETYTLIRKLQPNTIVSNRLEPLLPDESSGLVGKWGDYATPENRVGSYCSALPWETCATMGKGWPWRNDDEPNKLNDLLNTLSGCVGGDGNLLLNVGPNALGEFQSDFVERLKEIGSWLKENGAAVYGTRGGPYVPTAEYSATRKNNTIYIHAKRLDNGKIKLPLLPVKIINARLFDNTTVNFSTDSNRLTINVPASKQDKSITIVELEVKGNAMDIPVIPPFSKTNSLIYYKAVKASSSITPLFMHNPEAVTDDNDETFWTPGRNTTVADSIIGKHFESCHDSEHPVWLKSGWLEVSFNNNTTIQSAIIKEHKGWGGHSPVTLYKLECEVNGVWQVITTGTTITGNKIVFPKPVKTKKIRLSIQANGRMAISEFQVFAD